MAPEVVDAASILAKFDDVEKRLVITGMFDEMRAVQITWSQTGSETTSMSNDSTEDSFLRHDVKSNKMKRNQKNKCSDNN